MKWSFLPATEESLLRTVSLLGVIFALVAAITYTFNYWYGFTALLLLMISTARYFLPTRYEIDDSGVRVSFLFMSRQRQWNNYLRYSEQRNGVFLSTFAKPSRLDNFRGDFLKWSSHVDPNAVMAQIKTHIGK